MSRGRRRSFRNLERLGNNFTIAIDPDEHGYIGRECPSCEQYFKIMPGTGITEGEPPCHCPYCGHSDVPPSFFTKAQSEYARSVMANQITDALMKDMKSLEFDHKPKGSFGIGFSMKVKGRPYPISRYVEADLEEEVVCDNCTLRYTIYGTFAYCPDCRRHNSLQILGNNLVLAEKLVGFASGVEVVVAQRLVENALEDCVSAFDGFGREACRVHASKATDPKKAESIRFQSLKAARS